MFQVLLLLVSGSSFLSKKIPAEQRCAKAEEFEHVSLVKIFRLGETFVGISWQVGVVCWLFLVKWFGPVWFFKVRTLGR